MTSDKIIHRYNVLSDPYKDNYEEDSKHRRGRCNAVALIKILCPFYFPYFKNNAKTREHIKIERKTKAKKKIKVT